MWINQLNDFSRTELHLRDIEVVFSDILKKNILTDQ